MNDDATRDTVGPNDETCHDETADSSWLDSNVGVHRDEWIGQKIGDYEILRIIGTGGMGNVYEAKQVHPHRSVALKIVKSAAATPGALHRFEMESEMLARLQHPGIAQVYDSGHQTSEGVLLPYFAMEFVPGSKSITDFAEDKHLSREGRLALFLRVCEAVQYGHGRGVIHRDLKPSNILITQGGRPKVIDFGVALMAGVDDVEKTVTVAGRFVGTLQWSSPEQCGDDPRDVDVRTDVYSLGVLLYQLMTGQLPYNLKGIPLYRAPMVIRETKPIAPQSIDPSMPAEIEQILMKALAKERESRYDAVASMSMDIRRFLSNQPILAKPPTAMHRLRLYARRNQLKFRAALVVALALVLGFAGLIWGFVESEARQTDMKNALALEAAAREQAEQKAYAAMIGTTQAAIANSSWDMARRSLDATSRDQRGWEWNYLQGLVDQSLRTWLIGDRPTSLVTSPAGDQFIVTFEGGRVVLVDERRSLTRDLSFPSKVNAACFTPDGASLLLGMESGAFSLLHLSEETMLMFEVEQPSIESIVSLPDGGFATGHADGVIRVWDKEGNMLSSMVDGHGMVLSLDYDSTSDVLAAGAFDGTVSVWEVEAREPLVVHEGHDEAVYAVHFLHTGTLVSGGGEGNIILWNITANEQVTIHSGHREVMGVTSNENVIATTGQDRVVRLWDFQGNQLGELRGHEDLVWSIGTLRDDKFVSIGKDGSVRWWDASPPAPTKHIATSQMPSSDVAFIWNDEVVSVSEFDSNVQVIDLVDGTSSVIHSNGVEISAVAFVFNTPYAVTGDLQGIVRLWDIDERTQGRVLGECNEQITTLSVSSSGKIVAVGTLTGKICAMRINEREAFFETSISEGVVLSIALNDDGSVIFVSVIGGAIYALDVSTGEQLWEHQIDMSDVIAMEYIASMHSLLTATSSGVIQMLSSTNGVLQQAGSTSGGSVRDLIVLPDETRFVVGIADGTIGVWDTKTCSFIASFPAKNSLGCIAISRDGYRLAIGGGDATIRLLDGMTPGARLENSTIRNE